MCLDRIARDAGRLPSAQGWWVGRGGGLWWGALGNVSEAGACVDASVRINVNQFIGPRAGTASVYGPTGGAIVSRPKIRAGFKNLTL